MIELNFYFFLAVLELLVVLVIIVLVQGFFLKKYRPYFMANTRPELFLRKYIQRLIKQTQKFAKPFSKSAAEGDDTAIKTQQHMTARLNWLVLERDFAVTTEPDIRYWEDLNNRIKSMLKEWKEVEIIKEPPELKVVKLAIDSNVDDIDFENMDIDQAAKDEITALKARNQTLSSYEQMYKEMDLAYRTLEESYNELKNGFDGVELEAKEAEKLRKIIEQQEANEANLNAMIEEVEKSKERLNEELEQLEEAYGALEQEAVHTSGNALKSGDSPDAKEIRGFLNKQEEMLGNLSKTLSKINLKPAQQDKVDKHTDDIKKTNKEINHCLQMLELERERLAEELEHLQNDEDNED